jgi:hypothetical protein
MLPALVGACSRDVPSGPPATPADAARLIDLTKFPLAPGAAEPNQQTVAGLSYSAPGKVQDLFEFQRQRLTAQNWKELDGSYLSDQAASATFRRAGYSLSVSVFAAGADGMANVSINHHGNVSLGKLPVPQGATQLFAGPVSTSYVTETPAAETADAVRELLVAEGWEPYGAAGDVQYFRQKAIRLSARVLSAPAQDGKTMIDYSSVLMSAELPAPPEAEDLRYSDTPTQIFFDTSLTHQEVAEYYAKRLAEWQWKATTEKPIAVDFKKFQIFRNPPMDLLTLELTEVDGKSRVLLRFQTAAEISELERRIEEEKKSKAVTGGAKP